MVTVLTMFLSGFIVSISGFKFVCQNRNVHPVDVLLFSLTQHQHVCSLKGGKQTDVKQSHNSVIRRYVSHLTLISFVCRLHQGYCQRGLLVQPPHQFQERAVGPGPKPGPAESSPAPADSAESWHLARHRSWAARCHKGVQVAVPQPPLELSDHPQPGRFWQNCQPW